MEEKESKLVSLFHSCKHFTLFYFRTVTNISIDEDNMVTCTTCNEKVNNDEWVKHNREEHNNLAWRNGEPEIVC